MIATSRMTAPKNISVREPQNIPAGHSGNAGTVKNSARNGGAGISAPLLAWYDIHARRLPWRALPGTPSPQLPYRVWLSEIMLQQTTVATVKGRYTQFLALWPTVEALAAAPLEAVLKEWAGLGYYARARNLHKTAQIIAQRDGVFPSTQTALLELPGIGPYTAAAIAAIAFGVPATVMDGNIERVMARLFDIHTPLPAAKPLLKEHAAACTPQRRAGDYAQALMDLGATICTPRNPLCALCPLNGRCAALKAGTAADLPRKAPRAAKPVRRAYFYVARHPVRGVLVEKRPDKGLLGGMFGLPTHPWEKDTCPGFNPPFDGAWVKHKNCIRHTFTHFHLDIEIWDIVSDGTEIDDRTMAARGLSWRVPEKIGLPTVFKKALMR